MNAAPVLDEKKYARLLARTLPTVIENDSEHTRLLAEAENLVDKGSGLTPEEARVLKLLAHLIQEYEDKRYPVGGSSTPHSILLFLMEQKGLTHKDVWHLFGSKGVTSEVINGKRAISKTRAKALAGFFNVSVDLFF